MVAQSGVNEAQWEAIAQDALAEQEWQSLPGTAIAPGTEGGRTSWSDLILPSRILAKLRELNPHVPGDYLVQARAEILEPRSQDAIAENYRAHEILTKGYRGISYIDSDGVEQNPTIRLVSHRPWENEFLAVKQVTIRSTEVDRRFDIVCYLNGLPVAIFELKRASARVELAAAHAQLATYLREFPMAFRFAMVTVISDGITARYGTPFTPLNHYSPWNVDDDGNPMQPGQRIEDADLGIELEYLIDGVFNPERFLQLQRNFTAFDGGAEGYAKRIAKPHQYFAVTKAVGKTVAAVNSDGRAGVVWHTQGSGKSMEMELYAHLASQRPELRNPTFVVVTDRRQLDGQLFESFARSQLLAEQPVAVTTRAQLRDELASRTTGGILFTTLQKFSRTREEREAGPDHPLLSERRNIIVIADEAHRSHYDDLDGYAKYIRDALPNASFIAFTGTPISFEDRNTEDVFGPVIDTYDLTRAVDDGATVPVYFEARLIKVGLPSGVTEEDLDRAADEATIGLDEVERTRIEKSVAVINAVYGAPDRLRRLAEDLVEHWERRSAELVKFIDTPGKALIVGGTRKICADLYEEITRLRPDWHSNALDRGKIKVVYSGSAQDKPPISNHVRRSSENKTIQQRLRDPDDELQLVIVKDMLLTGFDSPSLHTLYLDRPLKGALLMQTLARVNRTFRGKRDGLLVGYAPLIDNLTKALAEYTANDQSAKPVGKNIDEAVALANTLMTKLDQVCAGFDWRSHLDGGPRSWIQAAVGLTNYLRSPHTPGNRTAEGEETLGERYRKLSNQLARAWALSSGSDTFDDLRRRDARFYEEVRVWMGKFDAQERQAAGKPVPEQIQRMLSALVASSTVSGEIVDIYEAAGIPKPNLAELGVEFRAKAKNAANPHLAIEALRALLTEESATVTRHNLVRHRAFSERIAELMRRYTNQQLTSAEVIAELIELAKEIAAERNRGAHFSPPLSHHELAFYDAVSANESAVRLQGEDVLAQIARDLVGIMQRDVKTDWTFRDDVRAKLRSSIKRLLVRYKYPPDKQPEAIRKVIEQMEELAPQYAAKQTSA